MQSLECAVPQLVRANCSDKVVVPFFFGLVAFLDIRENLFERRFQLRRAIAFYLICICPVPSQS